MLFVIYGLTLDVGNAVRTYLQNKGFKVIKKIVKENDEMIVKSYFVNREELLSEVVDKCDFQYDTNYGSVGFNNSDIFNAIYGLENAVLTMTSDNVEFFHHIKTGYGDAVPIICAYIDAKTQVELLDRHPQINDLEREKRLKTGKQVGEIFLENKNLFDDILIYGGEQSVFNMDSIYKQLDSILDKSFKKQKEFLDKNYVQVPYQGSENFVFLSYSHKDRKVARELLAFLQFNGVRVWYDAGIPIGDNWMNVIADKIKKAKAIVLLTSETAVKSQHVVTEVQNAIRFDKKILKINLDDSEFDSGIEMYFFGLNQMNYKEYSLEDKTSIISSLIDFDVVKK